MPGVGGFVMEDNMQSGGGGGGGSSDLRTIDVDARDARDMRDMRDSRDNRERRRSDAQERHVVINNSSNGERREENYNRGRERSHRERDNYDYNDNILTDPPNF